MSIPEQKCYEQNRIGQNIRRTVGIHALREIRGIVDEDLREEAARNKCLRTVLRCSPLPPGEGSGRNGFHYQGRHFAMPAGSH